MNLGYGVRVYSPPVPSPWQPIAMATPAVIFLEASLFGDAGLRELTSYHLGARGSSGSLSLVPSRTHL